MPIRCAFRVLHTFRFFRPKREATDRGAAWQRCLDGISAQSVAASPNRGLLSGRGPAPKSGDGPLRVRPQYDAADPVGPVARSKSEIETLLAHPSLQEGREAIPVWERVSGEGASPLNPFYRMEMLHAAQQALFGGHASDTAYFRLSPSFQERVVNDGNQQGAVPPAIARVYWQRLEEAGCTPEEGGIREPHHRHGMRGTFASIYDAKRGRATVAATEGSEVSQPRTSQTNSGSLPQHRRLATCTACDTRFSPAELWLSPYGIGVLCMTFDVTLADASAAGIQHLAYVLSQSDGERSPWLVFGRADDVVEIDASLQAVLTPQDRLGVPNQAMRVTELRDFYMRTLTTSGMTIAEDHEQRRHCVYSVVRHLLPAARHDEGSQHDVALPATADATDSERFVISLSQAEEESHPGTSTGATHPVPCEWLNASTLGAVSDQGAARIIFDQRDTNADARSHGFNYERYQRNRDRAFVFYLMALLQRLVLERLRGSVSSSVANSRAKTLAEVRMSVESDHRDLLDFAASSMLPVVSTRDTYNRWYEMSRRGNRVQGHYDALQQVMDSLDHSAQMEAQRAQSEQAARSLVAMTSLQEAQRVQNEQAARSLADMKSLQEAARDSADRARFLEALIVALTGVQFWFVLADLSQVQYWFALTVGAAAYGAALWTAWGALRIGGTKRLLYVGAGAATVVLAIFGKYFVPKRGSEVSATTPVAAVASDSLASPRSGSPDSARTAGRTPPDGQSAGSGVDTSAAAIDSAMAKRRTDSASRALLDTVRRKP